MSPICTYCRMFYSLFYLKIGKIVNYALHLSYKWKALGYLERKGVIVGKLSEWGRTKITIDKDSIVEIGDYFICRDKMDSIDNLPYSKISVSKGGKLKIGNYSGMSTSCILCTNEIIIGNYVNIGSGCIIMDTNFHSLNWIDRTSREKDIANRKTAPIHIGDYVFIGARCLICKGVVIGDRAIVAAGSVVVNNIPPDCIAGGNPCKIIKRLIF